MPQVMQQAIGTLDIHRPQFRSETANGVSLQNLEFVKGKLLEELVELEKQMRILELKDFESGVDFSMLQTYKEMIHSRRAYFKELNR